MNVCDARAAARASSVAGAVMAAVLAIGTWLAAPVAAASSNRACGLLTTKQVRAGIGVPVGAPVASKSGGKPVCEWRASGTAGSGPSLSVAIFPLTKADRAKFDQLADDADNRVVDDVGDHAVLECTIALRRECRSWGKLWVVVGDEYLGLSLVGAENADEQADALEALAVHAVKEF